MNDKPIGIFDSGVGGLTCVKELVKLMPNENIIYLGDTKRVPYGVNTEEVLIEYTNDDVNFLQNRDVKLIVAACGTVSSNVPSSKIDKLSVPFIDVIEPTVNAAIKATKNKKIGIIATDATIRSQSFHKKITKIDNEIQILGFGCPKLVDLIQNGYIEEDNQIIIEACKEYLSPIKEFGADTLILGCTHFPIISKIIQKIMGEKVTLINSGYETAKKVQETLKNLKMERDKLSDISEYYVTSNPKEFNDVAKIFLGENSKINAKLVNIKD